jgi:hypothetical protein
MYTASAPGNTPASTTSESSYVMTSSSTANSLSASSEDICYSTVTSRTTQTVIQIFTQTAYGTSSVGPVSYEATSS